MRTAFMNALLTAAERDPGIWLLTGDLGYSVMEPFVERFPDRYINVGIAEQNMTGVAAGLAMAGKTVLTYSIANFPTLRCLEQIRNDVCYHRLNVKVVAVGGGLAYGSLGYTHHAVEDLAIMRTLPHMAVAAPGDPRETAWTVDQALRHDGPVYLRLGKAGEPEVHPQPIQAAMGEPLWVREGRDVTLVSTGTILPTVVEAARELAADGVSAGVVSLPWLSPLAPSAAAQIASVTGRVVCVEEHGPGGLFAAFSEALAETEVFAKVRSVRLQGGPAGVSGTQESLRTLGGVSTASIVARASRPWVSGASRPGVF
ncbi:MAG: transketolase family protein [Fimbriimonas sp.]